MLAAGGRSDEPAAGTVLDPSEPLDVDVDQLARPLSLVPDRRLKTETSELAHPSPGQDPRHGRERHVEALGDLRAGEPHPSQRGDHLDAPFLGPVRTTVGAEERSSKPTPPSAR